MAQKSDIQYVSYYSAGTAARVLERQPAAPKPKAKTKARTAPARKIVVHFDPIAVIGTTVAIVMLVGMLVGIFRLTKINNDIVKMESYVSTLQKQNARLRTAYEQSYDLETVKTAAASMGLVPKDQVRHVVVTVPQPVVQEEPSWWESFVANFKELFA